MKKPDQGGQVYLAGFRKIDKECYTNRESQEKKGSFTHGPRAGMCRSIWGDVTSDHGFLQTRERARTRRVVWVPSGERLRYPWSLDWLRGVSLRWSRLSQNALGQPALRSDLPPAAMPPGSIYSRLSTNL